MNMKHVFTLEHSYNSDPNVFISFTRADRDFIDNKLWDLSLRIEDIERDFYTSYDIEKVHSIINEISPYLFYERKNFEFCDFEEFPTDNLMYIKKYILLHFGLNEKKLMELKLKASKEYEILDSCYSNIINYEKYARTDDELKVARHHKHLILIVYDKMMRQQNVTDEDREWFHQRDVEYFSDFMEEIGR